VEIDAAPFTMNIPHQYNTAHVVKVKELFLTGISMSVIYGSAAGANVIYGKNNTGVAFSTGGGGFSPNDVDGLGAWYDASDSTTITESSGRVSVWSDKKGSADLVQTTSGDQPLLVDAAQNDLDIIDFAGSRDMGTAGLSAIVQPQTWYVVATATSSDATRRPFWSGSQQFFTATTPEFRIYAGGQIGFNESLGTTQFYIWTLRFNGASSEMLLDDTSKVTGNAGTDSAGTLNVGGDSDKANNKFGEILRYDADVSSDDNDLIIDYLNDKWGL
tara:strand:+ start:188 stop:1006 length:819 start_codon:yes stop_codon:yes gene_type:complete